MIRTQTQSQTLADIETAHGTQRQTEDGIPITRDGNIHSFAPTGASSSSTQQTPQLNPTPATLQPSIRQQAMTANAHRPPYFSLFPQTGSSSSSSANPQTYHIGTPPNPYNNPEPPLPSPTSPPASLGPDPLYSRDPWAGATHTQGKGQGKRESRERRRGRERFSLGKVGRGT